MLHDNLVNLPRKLPQNYLFQAILLPIKIIGKFTEKLLGPTFVCLLIGNLFPIDFKFCLCLPFFVTPFLEDKMSSFEKVSLNFDLALSISFIFHSSEIGGPKDEFTEEGGSRTELMKLSFGFNLSSKYSLIF
jgi:hypothetical protein